MEIDGETLRTARRRMGFRSQAAAARAVGVSPRLFGPWETSGVPPEYVEQVRRAFWPEGGGSSLDLSRYADIDLLTEIGRRFAQLRRERDEALEQLVGTHPYGGEAVSPESPSKDQKGSNLPEPGETVRRFTGKRPPRPDN